MRAVAYARHSRQVFLGLVERLARRVLPRPSSSPIVARRMAAPRGPQRPTVRASRAGSMGNASIDRSMIDRSLSTRASPCMRHARTAAVFAPTLLHRARRRPPHTARRATRRARPLSREVAARSLALSLSRLVGLRVVELDDGKDRVVEVDVEAARVEHDRARLVRLERRRDRQPRRRVAVHDVHHLSRRRRRRGEITRVTSPRAVGHHAANRRSVGADDARAGARARGARANR